MPKNNSTDKTPDNKISETNPDNINPEDNKASEEANAGDNTPEDETAKFTVERLGKDCYRLFGVSSSTYDGATYGVKGEHTVEEVRNIIDSWLKKQVAPAKKKEDKE